MALHILMFVVGVAGIILSLACAFVAIERCIAFANAEEVPANQEGPGSQAIWLTLAGMTLSLLGSSLIGSSVLELSWRVSAGIIGGEMFLVFFAVMLVYSRDKAKDEQGADQRCGDGGW